MTFPEYIRAIGVSEFARKFGITERAATSYLRGARRPRPELAERIVKKTPVDWPGVYASSRAN
jgi:transcriptional regulator with XRE-family HTH domain